MQTPLGVNTLSIKIRLYRAPSTHRRYFTQTDFLDIQGDQFFDSIFKLKMNNAVSSGGYRSVVNHISRMLSTKMLTLQITPHPL
jgi:hypothetical protein